jgi:hypothetical protein
MILTSGLIRWSIAVALCFVAIAVLLPEVMQAADNPTLIGWWKFDDGSGTTATDSGGLGNDGELEGDAEFTSDGVVGGAVKFFGTQYDHVEVLGNPSLEPATGTFQAWIKVDTLHNADIVRKTTNYQVRSEFGPVYKSVYGLRISAGGRVLAFIGNDADLEDFWTFLDPLDVLITEDTWHHVAMRWDGTIFTLFVDGVIRDEKWYWAIDGIGLSYSGNSSFFLGAASSGTFGGEFIGQMDDVRFFGWARTDKEIYKDFKTRGLKPPKLKDKEN